MARDPLAVFHEAAATVPAYADFLRARGIDAATIVDFADVPVTTKENYHGRYPLPQRCRDGRLDACDMIAVSSGSSGQPTFWPRSGADEEAVVDRFEQVFRDSFGAASRRTLAVVCFALGTWVGGMYTATCCRRLAARGYPITVVTPGNNIDEILRVVPSLAPHFDQVVLLGYPPFLKEVIDAGVARGVEWAACGVRLVLAGEVFGEEWRDLVGARAGLARPCFDSASLYGTADAGVLGNETPLSIAVRRFLARSPDAARELFGESRLPTLVQYDPAVRYFETAGDGTLLFTADGGVPLVRYHIADSGGLIDHGRLLDFCAARGFDPRAEVGALGGGGAPMPFVYVFGRSLFTVSYFGANVYPENIAAGLQQPAVNAAVTGKFVLWVAEDDDRNRHLCIAVELAPGVVPGPDLRDEVTASILAQLLRLNSEFAHYVPAAYRTPRVSLHATGDPQHFPPGVKHRYTRPL